MSVYVYKSGINSRPLNLYAVVNMSMTSPKSQQRERNNSQDTSYFSIPYIIFMYKEELRKRDAEFMKLSKAKICLTDNLITNIIRNIRQYDVKEVMNINQQMLLKKRLSNKMHKIRKLEKMGIKDIDPNCLSDDM